MLDRQGLQAPFSIDMSWTCIQHVDELLAFIPAPEAPRDWLLVQPDPDAALTLLSELDGARPLPLYEAAYGLPTVDALRSDPDMLAATAVARDAITRARETLRREIGLDDDDTIGLPVLFHTSPLCGPGYLTALTPNLVNLASVTLEDGTTHLFLPDPHLGEDDPFVAASLAALPETAEVHIVDDWEAYHLGEGEVHCATNLRRTPTGAPWWTSDE